MAKIYITSAELVVQLKITTQRLIEIEHFFDSDPNDEWELIEGKDYRIVVQATGLREYTDSGAYSIARYVDLNDKVGLFSRMKDWFSRSKKKVRQAFIRKRILENSASLVRRNNIFYISQSDVVSIFETRSDYLKKMAEHAQRQEFALIKGEDYDDFIDDGGIHYSLSGIVKLSRSFHACLTQRNRRDLCSETGDVIESEVNDIVRRIQDECRKKAR
jgi:hypothetical protein